MRSEAPAPPGDSSALQRKLSDLVARRQYSQALRVREQTLRRHPDWSLSPSEAQLWCLEGRQAVQQQQSKRAEAAFLRALTLAPGGEALLGLARLRLDQEQPQQALALLEESFNAAQLAPELAGAYLRLLLLLGQEQTVRTLLKEQPRRFQSQQMHWAAGVLSLLEGNPAQARRQFERMAAPSSPGDHSAVWRAWALRELGDSQGAAAALKAADHPACAALALDLAAGSDQLPDNLQAGARHHPPAPEKLRALELRHQLLQGNHLQAAELLISHERLLLHAFPELAELRRPLLRLAGQQALDREAPGEAIRCWRLIVDRPALDPDLALRLYPLLIEGNDDDLQEAERLAGLLLGWLRRAARGAPPRRPAPRLSNTLARLHCWQADAQMRLGMRQQARRSVEHAHQLAPDLADVTGCRGLLTEMNGDTGTAIPLLWQALEAGSRQPAVFHVLEEVLADEGRQQERQRLLKEHGRRFGVDETPHLEAAADLPLWLVVLSEPDGLAMANTLSAHQTGTGGGLEALRIFSDHVTARGSKGSADKAVNLRRLDLQVQEASERWDALLAGLPPQEQVEALTALVAATLRFCRRSGKVLEAEITARLLQLEGHLASVDVATAELALRGLLLLLGLRLKRGERPDEPASRLLRGSSQPERLLPLALLDLRMLSATRPWQELVRELRRQDPENPLLSLALATMERSFTVAYSRLSDQAFEQARRQQDRQALALCRREQAWIEAAFDREQARRRACSLADDPLWQKRFSQLNPRSLLLQMLEQTGAGPTSEADLELMLPEFERQMREAFARMGPEEFQRQVMQQASAQRERGAEAQERPAPPRPKRRRRTFMDL
jgi:hypothetical protein